MAHPEEAAVDWQRLPRRPLDPHVMLLAVLCALVWLTGVALCYTLLAAVFA